MRDEDENELIQLLSTVLGNSIRLRSNTNEIEKAISPDKLEGSEWISLHLICSKLDVKNSISIDKWLRLYLVYNRWIKTNEFHKN